MNMMRLATVLLMLAMVGCSAPDSKASLNGAWAVEEIDGAPLPPEKEGMRPRLQFLVEEGQVVGTAGCNAIRARIESLTNTEIGLGKTTLTRKRCADMSVETAFNGAFGQVKTWAVEGGTLKLANAAGDVVLTFKKDDR